jgi:hypothetical protein
VYIGSADMSVCENGFKFWFIENSQIASILQARFPNRAGTPGIRKEQHPKRAKPSAANRSANGFAFVPPHAPPDTFGLSDRR